jgi:hypothetical protein
MSGICYKCIHQSNHKEEANVQWWTGDVCFMALLTLSSMVRGLAFVLC